VKTILLALIVVASPAAFAETVLVEPGPGHMFVGDEFSARSAVEVLYQDRPCKLPVVNAKDMREYTTTAIAIHVRACWGRTLGGGVLRVFEDGSIKPAQENAYVVASVDKTGNAVVTKSIYDKNRYEPCTRKYQKGQWCLKGQD